MTKKSIVLPIQGMHCASCAARIEKALTRETGILTASVSIATESAKIEYTPDITSSKQIIEKIRDTGYEVPEEKTVYKILGMHCASCVARVEKALLEPPWVQNVQVNLAAKQAIISSIPGQKSEDELRQALEKAGDYQLTLPDRTMPATHSKSDHGLKIKLIAGLILSPLIFIGTMWPHLLGLNHLSKFYNDLILFLMTLPVVGWVGSHFFTGGWKQIKHRSADMNTLIALGSGTAFLYSTLLVFLPTLFGGLKTAHVYFDTAAMIITLVLLGRYLETRARARTSEAVQKLMQLTPKLAHRVHQDKEIDVPVESLVPDDMVRIKPGETIPADGIIEQGEGAVDESMITGESIPVDKTAGDPVIGGTLNTTGSFLVRITQTGEQTILARIIKAVTDAQSTKAPIQRLADQVAAVFVPVVIGIALVTLMIWLILGPEPVLQNALLRFITVVIISCPCALGLATPTAIIAGTGNAAKQGVLIKGGEVLETLKKIDTLIFDKTGTLTSGIPEVVTIIPVEKLSEQDLIQIAASAEQHSEHPLAKAIVAEAEHQNIPLTQIEQFKALPGFGLQVKLNGDQIIIGSVKKMTEAGLLSESFHKKVDTITRRGLTPVCIARNKKMIGMIGCADQLRENAVEVVNQLQNTYQVILLTGDHPNTARQIANQLNISVIPEVLPEDKANIIRQYQEKGNIIAMVGDGINDAPALAQADIGMAMATGTDIAIETADISLMRNDLALIPKAIELSQKTVRTIKQNLFWAFFYNVLMIPVAAGLLYPLFGILLKPIYAAAAMSLSSLIVVGNALRLKGK